MPLCKEIHIKRSFVAVRSCWIYAFSLWRVIFVLQTQVLMWIVWTDERERCQLSLYKRLFLSLFFLSRGLGLSAFWSGKKRSMSLHLLYACLSWSLVHRCVCLCVYEESKTLTHTAPMVRKEEILHSWLEKHFPFVCFMQWRWVNYNPTSFFWLCGIVHLLKTKTVACIGLRSSCMGSVLETNTHPYLLKLKPQPRPVTKHTVAAVARVPWPTVGFILDPHISVSAQTSETCQT